MYEKKLSMKKTNSIFILMQSYDEFGLIPRIFANSSLTCVDKHPVFGQIKGYVRFSVQRE